MFPFTVMKVTLFIALTLQFKSLVLSGRQQIRNYFICFLQQLLFSLGLCYKESFLKFLIIFFFFDELLLKSMGKSVRVGVFASPMDSIFCQITFGLYQFFNNFQLFNNSHQCQAVSAQIIISFLSLQVYIAFIVSIFHRFQLAQILGQFLLCQRRSLISSRKMVNFAP